MEPYVLRAVLNGIDQRNHDFCSILMRKKIGNSKMFLIEIFGIFGGRVWDFLKLWYLDIRGNSRLSHLRYQKFRSKTFLDFRLFFYALICPRSRDSAGLFHSERPSIHKAPFFVQKLPVILFFLEMDSCTVTNHQNDNSAKWSHFGLFAPAKWSYQNDRRKWSRANIFKCPSKMIVHFQNDHAKMVVYSI